MADNKENIANLARNYPPGSRGLGVLVLREYAQIESARQRGWAWKDITGGHESPRNKGQGTRRSVPAGCPAHRRRTSHRTGASGSGTTETLDAGTQPACSRPCQWVQGCNAGRLNN